MIGHSGYSKRGFTGSRNDPTDAQLDWLWRQFDDCGEWHHGACVGADEASHQAAIDNGLDGRRLVVHPPTNSARRMHYDHRALWLPGKPYLDRNRDIVDATDELLAMPNAPEDDPRSQRSGTWMTIRYAVQVGRGVAICYPDGRVEVR